MLHELFITHCTKGTLIMNPFTFIKDSYNHETQLEVRKLEKLEIQLAKSRTADMNYVHLTATTYYPFHI